MESEGGGCNEKEVCVCACVRAYVRGRSAKTWEETGAAHTFVN